MIRRLPLCVIALALSLATGCGGSSTGSTEPHEHAHEHEHQHQHSKQHADAPHRHGMPHRFENAEQWAERFDDPARDEWQKPAEVVAALELSDGMTVADIGAGTGYFLPYLSPAVGSNGRVLGLDIEPDMVRYMKERATRERLANVDARVVTADSPELDSESVDRVLIVNTWHHIGSRIEYAKQLTSALRPGGAVYIVDFTLDSPHGPPKHHRLKPEAVIAELTAGGLKAEVLSEELPYQYIVVGRR